MSNSHTTRNKTVAFLAAVATCGALSYGAVSLLATPASADKGEAAVPNEFLLGTGELTTNEYGLTTGPSDTASNMKELPDLVAVQLDRERDANGDLTGDAEFGYLLRADYAAVTFPPNAGGSDKWDDRGPVALPAYAADGVTKVGTFTVGGAEGDEVRYVEATDVGIVDSDNKTAPTTPTR